jgi:hypothetical protein
MYSISNIEKVYPNWYDPIHALSRDDQLFIWENTPLPKEAEQRLKQLTTNKNKENVSFNGSVNGGRKLTGNADKTTSKGEAILSLRNCSYKTAPKIIASYLEILFSKYPSINGHWLFIAQHFTPKTINSLINQTIIRVQRGELTLQNPSSYFTDTILRHRKMRKKYRGIKFRIKTKEL